MITVAQLSIFCWKKLSPRVLQRVLLLIYQYQYQTLIYQSISISIYQYQYQYQNSKKYQYQYQTFTISMFDIDIIFLNKKNFVRHTHYITHTLLSSFEARAIYSKYQLQCKTNSSTCTSMATNDMHGKQRTIDRQKAH